MLGVALVGFEDGVEVGAAEPERAHSGAAGMIGGGVQPGAEPGADVERARREIELGVRRRDADRRRQHLVVERQRGVDQPRQPRRALGVADRRLDRPQRTAAARRAGRAEDLGQRGDLGQVARRGPGAVGLDVADGLGRDPRPLVGAPQRPDLALGAGRGQPLGTAVAGAAQPLDHGIDPVAVALGVGQPLEDDDADRLADHDAVGPGVERPAAAARRERVGLAEGQVRERILNRVGAAQDHHVGRARLELADRRRRRGQRRSAGGVDRVVRPAQVEPVRDPPRRDVQQDARETSPRSIRAGARRSCCCASVPAPGITVSSSGRYERKA